jgi:hypothetical protein
MMMRAILILLAFVACAEAQVIELPYHEDNWSTTPGEWTVPYEVPAEWASFMDQCRKATACTSFMAQVQMKVPTCLRFLDPKVIKDGREILGHVSETGTPGEPDWEWGFQTDELFVGSFTWKVKTIDVCPKVG